MKIENGLWTSIFQRRLDKLADKDAADRKALLEKVNKKYAKQMAQLNAMGKEQNAIALRQRKIENAVERVKNDIVAELKSVAKARLFVSCSRSGYDDEPVDYKIRSDDAGDYRTSASELISGRDRRYGHRNTDPEEIELRKFTDLKLKVELSDQAAANTLIEAFLNS